MAFWWLLGFTASSLVSGVLIAATAGFDEALPLWVIALGQVPLWLGLVGGPVWVSRVQGSGNLVRDFRLRARPVDVPVGLAVGLVTQVVLVPLLYELVVFPLVGRRDVSAPARELTSQATGWGVALLFVIVVLGAPVVEELFFRGLVLDALLARMHTVAAVVASSLVFAAVHLQLLQLPALVLFGVATALLRLRTGRLGPPIAAHVGFNAWTVVVLVWFS